MVSARLLRSLQLRMLITLLVFSLFINRTFLFDVLTELRNLIEVPVVVNTSFDFAGDPLVETFQDSVKSFIYIVLIT